MDVASDSDTVNVITCDWADVEVEVVSDGSCIPTSTTSAKENEVFLSKYSNDNTSTGICNKLQLLQDQIKQYQISTNKEISKLSSNFDGLHCELKSIKNGLTYILRELVKAPENNIAPVLHKEDPLKDVFEATDETIQPVEPESTGDNDFELDHGDDGPWEPPHEESNIVDNNHHSTTEPENQTIEKKSNKNLKHQCRICSKLFSRLDKLKPHICNEHIAGVNPDPDQPIDQTQVPVEDLDSDAEKELAYKGLKSYCSLCHLEFAYKKEFYKHCDSKHGDVLRPFKCLLCPDNDPKIFTNAYRLAQHYINNHETSNGTRPRMLASPETCKAILGSRRSIRHRQDAIDSVEESPATTNLKVEITKSLIECNKCGRTFRIQYQLAQHKLGKKCKELSSEPKQVCPDCKKEFRTLKKLEHHVLVKHEHGLHLCEQCGKYFNSKTTLRFHVENMHEKKKNFTCSECGKEFYREITYKYHMNKHNKQNAHVCELCGRSYSYKSDFKRHMNFHNGAFHQCQVCGKKWQCLSDLTTHMAVHSDERPFQCSFCPMKFKIKNTLITHEKHKHTSTGSYACEVCGKTFNSPGNRRGHFVRVHTTERPFKCDLCPKRFPDTSTRLKHMRSHSGEHPFSCRICLDRQFRTTSSRKKHEMKCKGVDELDSKKSNRATIKDEELSSEKHNLVTTISLD